MKTKLLRSPYRLLTNLLALAVVLGALFASPPPSSANAGWICESGCTSWSQNLGCTYQLNCCSHSSGEWYCWAG